MSQSIPIRNNNTPAYAKLDPSPSDLRLAAEAISLILSVAEIDAARVIQNINANIDKPAMLATLHNYLSDCNGELTAPVTEAAAELAGHFYDGISARGPFYRSRV